MADIFSRVTDLNKNPGTGDNGYVVYSKQFNDLIDTLNALLPDKILEIDTIREDTGNAGVTVDGVQFLDYKLNSFRRNVTSLTSIVTGSTVTLNSSQSGSIFLMDKTDGLNVYLPTDAIGLHFTFLVTANLVSNNYSIIANDANDLMIGGLFAIDDDSTTANKFFAPDGENDITISFDGTNGGEIGTEINLTCVANNRWYVSGHTIMDAALAPSTPFS